MSIEKRKTPKKMTTTSTTTQKIEALNRQLSLVAGVNVELTYISGTSYSVCIPGNNTLAVAKIKKFLHLAKFDEAAQVYDEELNETYAYFTV